MSKWYIEFVCKSAVIKSFFLDNTMPVPRRDEYVIFRDEAGQPKEYVVTDVTYDCNVNNLAKIIIHMRK